MFADPEGRRWRRTRYALIVLLAVALVSGGYLLTIALRPLHAPANAKSSQLTVADTGPRVPSFGVGPLTRLVQLTRINGNVEAIEPFTRQRVATLTPEDADKVKDSQYAVQSYGYGADVQKTISLTFDDGPDGKVTPELLDALKANGIHATFFMQGRNIILHPELVRRMIADGHTIASHTIYHPDLGAMPRWRETFELVVNERIIRALTGDTTTLWRMPYDDGSDTSTSEDQVEALLRAQRMGYIHATYDFDTLDWQHAEDPHGTAADISLPDFSTGNNFTVLMHDAGGPNRERGVDYITKRLVPEAKKYGYTFTSVTEANPTIGQVNAPATVTPADRIALFTFTAYDTWPTPIMVFMFGLTVLLTIVYGGLNSFLALGRFRRRRRVAWPDATEMSLPVTVLLAAYNEEPVIERTIRTVLRSRFPITEVLVVNDGSTDGTGDVVATLAALDPRVRLVTQPNGGKSHALNNGLTMARGEIIVTLDADTIVTEDTVGNLVRHFANDPDGKLGGVAGVVRVGNRGTNLLTRWQALEYLTQIGLDRSAQDAIEGISIIPGACAAWRKSAIISAGGYATDNLAEDCDLALTLHELGWRVAQDDDAYAFTEAPESVDDLLKQRVRWTYGTMQAMWKHRGLLFSPKHPGLGWYVLPNYLLSLLIPLVFIPFTTFMAVLSLDREGPRIALTFFALFVGVQLLFVVLSIRMMHEDWAHLWMVPIYRLMYEPLRAYLLYASVFAAWKGTKVRWNKLERTGSMDAEHGSAPAGRPSLAGASS